MDNVAFHKTNDVRYFISNSGHRLLLLSSYSPFLNPIEEVFNQLKLEVKRQTPNKHADLLKCIELSQMLVNEDNCQNYIRHSKSYFFSCLRKEQIKN